jgi:hypothetical protein
MEVALMLVSLPLMMLGGFALDALGHRDDDDKEDEEDDRHAGTQPDSGHPPII